MKEIRCLAAGAAQQPQAAGRRHWRLMAVGGAFGFAGFRCLCALGQQDRAVAGVLTTFTDPIMFGHVAAYGVAQYI